MEQQQQLPVRHKIGYGNKTVEERVVLAKYDIISEREARIQSGRGHNKNNSGPFMKNTLRDTLKRTHALEAESTKAKSLPAKRGVWLNKDFATVLYLADDVPLAVLAFLSHLPLYCTLVLLHTSHLIRRVARQKRRVETRNSKNTRQRGMNG